MQTLQSKRYRVFTYNNVRGIDFLISSLYGIYLYKRGMQHFVMHLLVNCCTHDWLTHYTPEFRYTYWIIPSARKTQKL